MRLLLHLGMQELTNEGQPAVLLMGRAQMSLAASQFPESLGTSTCCTVGKLVCVVWLGVEGMGGEGIDWGKY